MTKSMKATLIDTFLSLQRTVKLEIYLLFFILCCLALMTSSLSTAPTPIVIGENEVRVAFMGNSILYFNDCPRLVEHMLRSKFQFVEQDSCLRGGTSLPELWEQGNGMRSRFGVGCSDLGKPTVKKLLSSSKKFNFVVMNDYTQAPARPELRNETVLALKELYSPLLQQHEVVVFLQTAAYRAPAKNSSEIGDVPEFTSKIREGCEEYVDTLKQMRHPDVRLAPVGDAYYYLYQNNPVMWNKLFYFDDFHPSPHGTWLEACVLFCTMLQQEPPAYQDQFFSSARYMQPKETEPMPLPTEEEAEELRQVACTVCGIATATT
jgi:hypothetical protein